MNESSAYNISINSNDDVVVGVPHPFNWFEWFTEGVFVLIIGIIGLLGNCISIWTFSRQKVHRIFHNLLLILAIFDIVSSTYSCNCRLLKG